MDAEMWLLGQLAALAAAKSDSDAGRAYSRGVWLFVMASEAGERAAAGTGDGGPRPRSRRGSGDKREGRLDAEEEPPPGRQRPAVRQRPRSRRMRPIPAWRRRGGFRGGPARRMALTRRRPRLRWYFCSRSASNGTSSAAARAFTSPGWRPVRAGWFRASCLADPEVPPPGPAAGLRDARAGGSSTRRAIRSVLSSVPRCRASARRRFPSRWGRRSRPGRRWR